MKGMPIEGTRQSVRQSIDIRREQAVSLWDLSRHALSLLDSQVNIATLDFT